MIMSNINAEFLFPVETDGCWERLKVEKRPVFIYGMGDGAIKIMKVMDDFGIPLAGIFASDEFVRGHSFCGYRVHTLSEIERSVDDFVIVLAFAAGYASLIEKITLLAQRHTLYAPDVPVIGGGLFTYSYYCENVAKINKVYSLLGDDASRKVFSEVINYKISGRIDNFASITSDKSEVYRLINPGENDVYVDLGAYNGDTVGEYLEYTSGRYGHIYAIEPDRKNYKKLVKSVENSENIDTLNCAAWNEDTELAFASKAGRQSTVSGSGTFIQARSVDSILSGGRADIIKLDVEGAEREAILGSLQTIKKFTPKLMLSLYHRNEDMFELPLLINSICPEYRLYIRHLPYIPAWETNLYACI